MSSPEGVGFSADVVPLRCEAVASIPLSNRLMKQESRMIAKTLQALEPVLAQELEALGATDIEQAPYGLLHRG